MRRCAHSRQCAKRPGSAGWYIGEIAAVHAAVYMYMYHRRGSVGEEEEELHNKNPPTPCLWQAHNDDELLVRASAVLKSQGPKQKGKHLELFQCANGPGKRKAKRMALNLLG